MKLKVLKTNCLSLLLLLCFVSTNKAQVFSLSGNDWKIKDIPNDSAKAFCNNWTDAVVPGNIQADLERNRILKPLWYGMGDSRLSDVAKNEWCYRKEFKIPSGFSQKRTRLIFDGVDNACEVWLNGKRLGSNPSMFRRFEFDVSDILKIGATNRIDIRLASIPAVLAPWIDSTDGKLSGETTENWYYIDGILKTLETLHDLKSPTNFGWDWGVNIWTLGIWKDVRIEASGQAIIDYLKVETPLLDNYKKAKVQVNLKVNSREVEAGILQMKISRNGIEQSVKRPFSLAKGDNKLYGEITVENPALWWPNGHGEQNLYNLDATLLDASGNELYTHRSRFGIREVRWELTAEAPSDFPEKYMCVVNGRPVRMIGTNLIPPDLLFARIPARVQHLLRLAKSSGFTILRFWGGGVIYTPEVYDLADELGIMLQIEAPFANTDPKGDSKLLKNLDTTLPNILHQIWNHPSIIEYTGGNEMLYGRRGDSTLIKHIRKIFAEEDPSRIFRDTDPIAGGVHGPWNFLINEKNPVDPLRAYSTWNFVIPRVLDKFGVAPTGIRKSLFPIMRYGEFGFQTPAHVETWQRDIPPSAQWPIDDDNPVLIRKNVTYGVFDNGNWLEKPVIDFLFGQSPNLEFLLKAGQYLGAEGLRYALDATRRRGAATGGMMTWDFNEPWTNGAGSYQVDYNGRPLMNYAFAKQSVAPLSLSLTHPSSLYYIDNGIQATLYLSSDYPTPVSKLNWSWKARDRRGTVISTGKGEVGIDPISVEKLTDISFPLPKKTSFGPVLLELQLSDASGKVLNERVQIYGLNGVSGSLKGLLDNKGADVVDDDPKMWERMIDTTRKASAQEMRWPELFRPIKRTELELESIVSSIEGDEEVLDLKLTNSGKMTALFCEPKPVLNYRTDMIIENLYVSIPPKESRIIRIRAPRKALDGLSLSQTGWRIECWNANAIEIPASSDVLLSLGRKDQMCGEFAGGDSLTISLIEQKVSRVKGRLVDPATVPYLLDENSALECKFEGNAFSPNLEAILSINSADQSTIGAIISIELNGKLFDVQIQEGYGFQKTNPAHLAQAKSVEISIPAGVLKQGENMLQLKIKGNGWFTWDSLSLRTKSK
jgi:beta-mannosidase